MSRLVICLAVVAVLAVTVTGADPITDHPWLNLGSADNAPEVPDSWLGLDDDRRRELQDAGWGAVELLWRFDLTVEGDGSLQNQLVRARHFLTGEGIQQGGTLSVGANAAIERLHLDRAFVRLPDGSTREFDLRRVQVIPDQEINVFSDRHRVMFPFEGLVPGSTAVIVVSSRRRVEEWPLPWSKKYTTQWFLPIERLLLTVNSEAGAARPVWVTNDDGLQCEELGRQTRCAAERREPLKIDEEVTSMYDMLPHVVVSERHGWGDIARRVEALVAEGTRSTSEIAATARRLVEDAETDRDRLARIHRFVADEIRYVGLEHGINAVVPAAAARTLDRRYGDCKDKTTLFLALAREAGLTAWPVLVGTDHYELETLLAPSASYFDHMIACAEVGEEPETVCADLTDPHSATGSLPPYLYGAIALAARPGSTEPHELKPPSVVHDVLVEVNNRFDCESKGLVERLERTYTGPTASFFRSFLRSMTVEARAEWAVEDYKEVMGHDLEPTFEFDGVDNGASDLVIRSELRYENFDGSSISEYAEPDIWMAHFAQWFTTANETLPYQLRGGRIRTVNSYHLCDGQPVRFVGAELKLESEFGSLRRNYDKKDDRTVTVGTELLLPSRRVAANHLAPFRRFLANALAQTGIWFDVATKTKPGGAR